MTQRNAVVFGAGVGGLAAAAALHHAGWAVELLERAASIEPVGAGFGIAPNALRALDTFGAGDAVRALAALSGDGGLRSADGRWLAKTSAAAVRARLGDVLVGLERRQLVSVLRASCADVPLHTGSRAQVLRAGDAGSPAVVATDSGDRSVDLVVAADGIQSQTRADLFPDHPGTTPTGWTSWRFVVDASTEVMTSETWGATGLVGLIPVADGRIYVYAAARAPFGERSPDDERAELLRRFGQWHAPIRTLIESVDPAAVLRHDLSQLAAPLPALHRGRVALLGDAAHPMTPFLGQGACQAIEDAVVLAHAVDQPDGLEGYTAARLPRTSDIVRRSYRMGTLSLVANPVVRAGRDAMIWLAGRLSPDTAIRRLAAVTDWRPPQQPLPNPPLAHPSP